MIDVKHHELPLLEATDTVDSEAFAAFFRAYEEAFILPDEMEDRDGFAVCLELNHGARHDELVARFGAFRELCLVAREPANGAIVGGANFIAMLHPGKPLVTANLNYVFTAKAARGQGWFRPLMAAIGALISGLFGPGRDVLIFIEQNDPLQLTPEAYARDSSFAGIDQFDRLRIWAGLGARIADFPYVQPPLSDRQKPDGKLIYSVIGASGDGIDACVLRHHLNCFFGVSVLKGQAPESVPTANSQLHRLADMCQAQTPVRLLDPSVLLNKLDRAGEAQLVREGHLSLREFLSASRSAITA